MDVHTALSTGATTGFGHATYYSYDVHGNVDHLVQDVPDLAAVSNQYKHLYYQYDLISGKVNQVDYSPGQRDEYHHRYTYDADNRIVQVETSKDAILWDKDANYQYYKHGPLSRAELGDLKVQGLDYAYTIQGWIKGVNSNTMSAVRDPGRDGDLSLSGNTHAKVATDAFGYTLGYFAGDYNPIGTFTTASKSEASTAGSDLLAARSDLWNGNISHMVTCLPKASDYAVNQTITPEAFGSAYQYDQLNRLSSSRVFTNINTTTNQWQSGAGTNPTAYATDYTYDAMGNILTQKRNGGGTSATALDELTYNYHTTTDGLVSNRLYHVNDVVSAGNYTDDIDDQGTFNNTHSTIETANNYGYDELGNLVRDVQEEIASIEWTVYGKMKKITRNSGSSKADLEFGYDASGNRLWKKVTPKGSGAVTSTYYYLRDAQGNEMCRYVKYTNTRSQLMYVAQEHSIYGSSRVGVDNRKDTLYMGAVYTPTWGGVGTSRRDLGSKSFELANHLGNVLVTISDKPIYKVSSTTIFFQPEITSISDYYPFGAPINGRSFSSTEYRFGFNTQEKTDEISGPGNHNTATFWEYDGRLGRRWNIDPVTKPWESLYACLSDNPIRVIDRFGDDGYIDENGNYLGDDRNNKSHQTRVISANAWQNTVGNKTTITDKMRKSLTGGSTLLTTYKRGIRITDDTWGKLTAAGGERLNPWLINNSDHAVFAKSEDGAEVFDVYGGLDLYYTSKEKNSGIDGFAAPHLRRNEVVKVSTGIRVTIDNEDYSTSAGGSFYIWAGNAWEGGWQNEAWLKQTSANKITTLYLHWFTGWVMQKTVLTPNGGKGDKQWIPIFQKSGLTNAPQYSKYYEITNKIKLID